MIKYNNVLYVLYNFFVKLNMLFVILFNCTQTKQHYLVWIQHEAIISFSWLLQLIQLLIF